MTVLTGLVIAAGAALALAPQLMPRSPGEGVREESALSIVPASPQLEKVTDKATDQAGDKAADDGRPGMMVGTAPVTDQVAASRAQISCDDLSGAFLEPQCRLGKTGKAGKARLMRAARAAASQRVTTVPIGHAEGAIQVEQQRPEQQRTAATGAANDAPTVQPPESPVPARKPVKIAHKQTPSRDAQNRDKAGAGALAAAPSPSFSLFNLFHEPPRAGNGV